MTEEQPFPISEEWGLEWLSHGDKFKKTRRLMRHLPTDPRCKICTAPFSGLGGLLVKPFGYGPSRKNPNMCASCFEGAPPGGVETEGGILFADVRGYTALSETMPPGELAALINRFYKVATDALIAHDGVVDKLVGDQVMGIFLPFLDEPRQGMVSAAEALLRGLGYGSGEPLLPVGIGLDFGRVFVGNVGGDRDVRDFTALGDAVNTASRLQGQAAGGQIVMSESVYAAVADRYPGSEVAHFELKGKSQPIPAHTITIGAPEPATVARA